METHGGAAQQLRDLERAEAAPYINYPATPPWYFAAVGLWATAMLGALTLLDNHPVWAAAAILVLVAAEVGFFRWYARYHGAMPSLVRGNAPREVRAEFLRYFAGVAVLAGLAVVVWFAGGFLATAPFVLIGVTGGLWIYEQRYARAAARVRERLE